MNWSVAKRFASFGLVLGLGTAGVAFAADNKKQEKPKPYPLAVCLVSDEKLGEHGKPIVMEHKGQEVKLCCDGCEEPFKKDPAKFMKKLDDAAKKAKDSGGAKKEEKHVH